MTQRTPLALTPLLLSVLVGSCGGDDPTGPGTTCGQGPTITLGGMVTGTLQQGDDLDIDGAFLDRYSLTLTEATDLVIDLESTEVDAYLWLLSSSGGVVENDDDSGEGLNARITESVNAGCYFVEATSSDAGDTGDYTLRVGQP